MAKNYYIVLGISPDANQQDIKSAYRQLVKELHPDHYGEDSQPFREIQQAYSVLSDPERKRAHDAELQRRRGSEVIVEVKSGAGTRRPPIEPIEHVRRPGIEEVFVNRSFETYSPSYNEIIDRLRSNFFETTRPKGERIESLNVEIELTVEQAQRGGQFRVMIPVHVQCPACRGMGGIGFFECWRCGGHGVVDEEAPIPVPYPAGTPNNHIVQIPLARFGIGNFYLTVRFKISE